MLSNFYINIFIIKIFSKSISYSLVNLYFGYRFKSEHFVFLRHSLI
ncbi:hypothetical protein BBU64B_F0005 (plasmid) [Borreliella burgdorferi 64b]|nr:hypothetical protein BBU64B_F0005 [Borreliella burgdorferi 64b]